MAKSKSSKGAMTLSSLWTNKDVPAPGLNDVLSQVAHFFEKLGYSSTLAALIAEAKKNGVEVDTAEWERGISQEHSAPLLELWEQWYQSNDGFPMLPASSAAQKQIKEKEDRSSGSDSESDSSDEDDSEDSDSDSDSDSEDETEGHKAGAVDDEAESTDDDSSEEESEEEEAVKPAASNKRKREDSPESSSASDSDGSDDESSSDGSDAPQAKRVKTEQAEHSDSDSDGGDDDSSDASSDSGSDSDSDSDSDSSSAASGAKASSDDSDSASGSDSDSDSDSDSSDSDSDDSESSASPPPKKKAKKQTPKPERGGSTSSSATLDHEPAPAPIKSDKKSKKSKAAAEEPPTEDLLVPASAAPDAASEDPHAGIHPDRLARLPTSKTEKFTRIPATEANVKAMKKENVPFSRIPKDTFVDPKFASNAYVPYDYAQKAHEDLIVTKGKGFTKEKNKKKRGSYRGGLIDLTPKGIKFED